MRIIWNLYRSLHVNVLRSECRHSPNKAKMASTPIRLFLRSECNEANCIGRVKEPRRSDVCQWILLEAFLVCVLDLITTDRHYL